MRSPATVFERQTPWLVAERFVQITCGVSPTPVMFRLSAPFPVYDPTFTSAPALNAIQ